MRHILGRIFLGMALSLPAYAAPFLVSDPAPQVQGAYTVSHCAYTRGTTTTLHAVETVTGGIRCRIDLASDPKTGTVTVAFRDNALGVTGSTATFSFGSVTQPAGLRVIP